MSEADRAALHISQSKRKRLEKLLVALRKKQAKANSAVKSAATGKGGGGAGGKEKRKKKTPADAPQYDDSTRPLDTPKGEKKLLNKAMASAYHPADVEASWYDWWEAAGFFRADATAAIDSGDDQKFVMVIPPPNVTGSLHLGHALMCAVQDSITRWHRMHGRIALYLPGVDHAGIATQVVVEKQLAREGKPGRREMGREPFVAEVWKWKDEYGGKICQQMRRIGSSLDWDREEFTMSEKLNAAVREAFVRFYDQGLIYRDTRLVNWSCALRTAISDIEVDTIELEGPTLLAVPGHAEKVEFGALTHFAYKLASEADGTPEEAELVVATTRLETMLGDVAVAVHPDDMRYKSFVGRSLVHPFIPDRKIVVVADGELVDMEFGTGAVKVTPAHDPNDFACGRRHNLPEITIFNDDGSVNAHGGPKFVGKKRYVARAEMEKELEVLGLLRGKTPNPMALGLCSRSGDIVEPLLKPQWWVDCKDLAKRSADAVRNGELKIVPESAKDTWYKWLDNIRDWCVSRQLWWGHRIPAYKATVADGDGKEVWVVGRSEREARERAAKQIGGGVQPSSITLEQDEDVLDTWFSSGLFPFSVFGWPDDTEDMKAFFPTSLLETGYDILFFWVARMVMMSLGLTGKLPFHTVCLHSMVRDKRGRKMSKSKGNVIDPLYVIDGTSLKTLTDKIIESNLPPDEIKVAVADKESEFPEGIPVCGADSLRMGLLAYMTQTGDINLDVSRVVSYRSFGNKLWNATRFAISNLGDRFQASEEGLAAAIKAGGIADRWILSRLNSTVRTVNESFAAFRLGDCVNSVHSFCMNDLFAVYLENMKPVMKGADEAKKEAARQVLFECLFATLRLLHPMMPFITEELYFWLPGSKPFKSLCIGQYPVEDASRDDESAEAAMSLMMNIVTAIRSVAAESGLKPQDRPEVFILGTDASGKTSIDASYVQTLANSGTVQFAESAPEGCAVKVVDDTYSVHLNIKDLIDVAAELRKLEAAAADKQLAIEAIEKKESTDGYEDRVPANIRTRNTENKAAREKELAQISELAEKFRKLL